MSKESRGEKLSALFVQHVGKKQAQQKLFLGVGSEGTKPLETSGNGDHCLEKLVTFHLSWEHISILLGRVEFNFGKRFIKII